MEIWMAVFGMVLLISGGTTLYQCSREDVPRKYRPWWAKNGDNQAANESQAVVGGVICAAGGLLVCAAAAQALSRIIHLY